VFFSYGSVSRVLIELDFRFGTFHLMVWLVIFICSGFIAVSISKNKVTHTVLIVAGISMLSLPCINILQGLLKSENESVVSNNGVVDYVSNSSNILNKPNVYWFLLDQYIRDDYLKKYFNFDNKLFLNNLENIGFEVAYEGYSNFEGTKDSLSTTLSMDYYMLPENSIPSVKTYVDMLSGFNVVVNNFKKLGYKYYHGPYAGSAKTQCRGVEDGCIRGEATGSIQLTEAEINLSQLTPFYKIITKLFEDVFSYDHLHLDDVDNWLNTKREGPYFLFAHILSPHGPPRYNELCERKTEITPSINMNGNYYDSRQYVTDVKCLNKKIYNIISKLSKNDKVDPIIIIQGDHGFAFKIRENDGVVSSKNELLKKRFANLNAIKLIPSCKDYFYKNISPVNTFRLVFACIQNTEPTFVADRQFIRNEDGFNEVYLN